MNIQKLSIVLVLAANVSVAYSQDKSELREIFQTHQMSIPNNAFDLPDQSTMRALQNIENQINVQKSITGTNPHLTPGLQQAIDAEKRNEPAVLVPDQVLIKVSPDIGQNLHKLIRDYELRPIQTFPEIGAFSAQVPKSLYYGKGLETIDPSAIIEDNNKRNDLLRTDPRIIEIVPNFVISPENSHSTEAITNTVMSPIPLSREKIVLSDAISETTDWGIQNVQADLLWEEQNAADGHIIGVMDVGFARHKDIAFLGTLTLGTPKHDHGNHVAGIICGKHDNSYGIKGVVPNCLVKAKSGEFLPIVSEGESVNSFLLTFSQILSTFSEFVRNRDEVSVFNVSLGYNWMPNFRINIDDPRWAPIRSSIQNQAVFLFPILKEAQRRNVLIFSAAGNDSSTLAKPMSAIWASPFNYAAKYSCEMQSICSGVIVEAHDEQGDRAAFSNVDGDISCPGVNIFSTVAFDDNGVASDSVFGKMSGTSMASPYCAGGLALLSSVHPDVRMSDLLTCVKQSGEASGSDAPRMKLKKAMEAC